MAKLETDRGACGGPGSYIAQQHPPGSSTSSSARADQKGPRAATSVVARSGPSPVEVSRASRHPTSSRGDAPLVAGGPWTGGAGSSSSAMFANRTPHHQPSWAAKDGARSGPARQLDLRPPSWSLHHSGIWSRSVEPVQSIRVQYRRLEFIPV